MTSMHKPQRKFTDETPEWTPVEGDAPHQIKQARNDALQEAVVAIKEPIAKIVYDSWYKNDWPVGSHGYQRVQEACESAITALMEADK